MGRSRVSDEETFWVAIPHETILCLEEDWPEAAAILARQAACSVSVQEELGPQPKKSVRAHYRRQREIVRALLKEEGT